MRKMIVGILICAAALSGNKTIMASEVIPETGTEVIVREHPKTGKPYVSIVSEQNPNARTFFPSGTQPYSRPDYRMLDYKVKSGEIPYDGPASDRKKVYIFAASVAAVGVAGGTVGLATASSTAASSAAGAGAGTYAAAGAGVAAGTLSTAIIKSQPDPHSDDYAHESESRLLRVREEEKEDSS